MSEDSSNISGVECINIKNFGNNENKENENNKNIEQNAKKTNFQQITTTIISAESSSKKGNKKKVSNSSLRNPITYSDLTSGNNIKQISNNSVLTLNPINKKNSSSQEEIQEGSLKIIGSDNSYNNSIMKKPNFLVPENRKLLKEKFEKAKEKILYQQENYLESIKKAIIENIWMQ